MKCENCGKIEEFLYCPWWYDSMSSKTKLCLLCFQEFTSVEPSVKSTAEKRSSRVALDPKAYPVIGWIKEKIFINEEITLTALKALMEDKGYAKNTIGSQIKRIERDYDVQGDLVKLRKVVKAS